MGRDDVTCPICRKDYENPRILPCGHTVCEDCLRGLLEKDETSWVCPECTTEYMAVDGVRSFPKNKYMLAIIKRRTPTPQKPSGPGFKKCKFHRDRFVSLYCRNERCKASICQLCHINEHKHHDVIDIKEEKKEKSKVLHAKLESVEEKLELRKNKILAAETEVAEKNQRCLKMLKDTKKKMVNAVKNHMDELAKDANIQISKINKKMNDDLSLIEEKLTELENLKESARSKSITYHDLEDKLEEVHKIETEINEDLSGHRSYHNTNFETENTDEDIKEICGRLVRDVNHIFLQNGEYSVCKSLSVKILLWTKAKVKKLTRLTIQTTVKYIRKRKDDETIQFIITLAPFAGFLSQCSILRNRLDKKPP